MIAPKRLVTWSIAESSSRASIAQAASDAPSADGPGARATDGSGCGRPSTPAKRVRSRLMHSPSTPPELVTPVSHPCRPRRRAPRDRLGRRPRDGLRHPHPPLALPVRLLPRRGRPARLARQRPDADRRADPARRRRDGRRLRHRADLGRRPPHRLLHVHDAARPLPVRECTGDGPGTPPRHPHPPSWTATRSTHDRRHDPVRRRPPRHRIEGHGLRARRPQPGPRRQPDGRAPLARRRRDPRVHEPARGHPPPGPRPPGPERDAPGRQRRSSRCASTARRWPGRCARSSPTAPPSSSCPTSPPTATTLD